MSRDKRADPPHPYVGRGGLKLRHALDEFKLDVTGLTCADFGCNVGGFTDCLLQAGAAKVYAVDTGYGALAWKLRNDPRIVVMERTNALHAEPPRDASGTPGVDLIAIDLAWTPQRHAIPAAIKWLRPRSGEQPGRIVSLIKPHYELTDDERASLLKDGALAEPDAERIAQRSVAQIAAAHAALRILGLTRSPIAGGAGKGKTGNLEWLLCLASMP